MTNVSVINLTTGPVTQQERINILDSLRSITILGILCGSSYLAIANYVEPYLAAFFQLWSVGMDLA